MITVTSDKINRWWFFLISFKFTLWDFTFLNFFIMPLAQWVVGILLCSVSSNWVKKFVKLQIISRKLSCGIENNYLTFSSSSNWIGLKNTIGTFWTRLPPMKLKNCVGNLLEVVNDFLQKYGQCRCYASLIFKKIRSIILSGCDILIKICFRFPVLVLIIFFRSVSWLLQAILI